MISRNKEINFRHFDYRGRNPFLIVPGPLVSRYFWSRIGAFYNALLLTFADLVRPYLIFMLVSLICSRTTYRLQTFLGFFEMLLRITLGTKRNTTILKT